MLRTRGHLAILAVALLPAGCGWSSEQDVLGAVTQPPAATAAQVANGPPSTTPTAPSSPTTGTGSQPAPPPASRAPGEVIGQRLVSGYVGGRPTASILRAVRSGQLGGVILFSDNVPTLAAARRAVTSIEAAAAKGGAPPPLILIDQEGGIVKRLESLPPTRDPAQIGAAPSPSAAAKREGRATGRALRKLGITVNLAPVVDVPTGPETFLGTRAFSTERRTVARAGCAFADGLADAGVAATLKHFPGLGRASGNTDFSKIVVPASGAQIRADLSAYRRCADTVAFVMLSSASYPALGINRPAVLVPKTYRLLESTGFRGLTISDAFDTPAIAGQERPAMAALRSGLDILLYGQNESGARNAYRRLVGDLKAGRIDRAQAERVAARIAAFKQSLER